MMPPAHPPTRTCVRVLVCSYQPSPPSLVEYAIQALHASIELFPSIYPKAAILNASTTQIVRFNDAADEMEKQSKVIQMSILNSAVDACEAENRNIL